MISDYDTGMQYWLRTSDSGETRVIPSTDNTLVHEPVKFPLRQKGINEVEATKVPDEDRAQVQSFDHPVVLWVTVTVFVSSESVRDTL